MIGQRVKNNISQLKDIFLSLLPQNRVEFLLLVLFILFYQSYSIIIALHTSVIDNKDTLYDVYFSFDNPVICEQGYVYLEGHPLMMYFTLPFISVGDFLSSMFDCYKAKTLFLSFICTVLISMSIVYVYRYLSDIVKIKAYPRLLFTLFYAFTSTNLILAFTPESFTITAFLLTFTIYYYSKCIQNKHDVYLAPSAMFAIALGGITITNFAKGIIPMLFLNQSWRVIIKRISIISFLFLCIMIVLQLQYDFIGMIKMRLTWNVGLPSTGVYYEKVLDLLFGAPVFFSHIVMMNINVDGAWMNAISVDFYRHWWQYLFSFSVLAILLFAVYRNFKKPVVQILLFLLAVDVFIHVFVRYGLRDGFIYGAHWMYFIPFMFGWLYVSLNKDFHRKILILVVSCLFVFLLVNNITELYNFIGLAKEHFPPYTELN